MIFFSNFVHRVADNLDKEIEEFGLQQTMLNILQRTETKFIVHGRNKKNVKILQTRPVIMVGSHIAESDPIPLFAALPQRDDLYAIGDSSLTNFCPQIDRHIIPVYIHHDYQTKFIYLKSYLLRRFNSDKKLKYAEAHQKNIESIRKASKMLKKGHSIVILPGNNDGKWAVGVGHLIKQAKNKNTIYLLRVLIEGTSSLDYLRLIPGIRKILPPIKITLSKPKVINYLQRYQPKEIAIIVRDEYFQWVRQLHIRALSRRRRFYIKLMRKALDFILFTLLPPAFVPVYRGSPVFYRPRSPKDIQEIEE
jgi:1-acyl-sn-glycerol-3-phosphate acyltransferase